MRKKQDSSDEFPPPVRRQRGGNVSLTWLLVLVIVFLLLVMALGKNADAQESGATPAALAVGAALMSNRTRAVVARLRAHGVRVDDRCVVVERREGSVVYHIPLVDGEFVIWVEPTPMTPERMP